MTDRPALLASLRRPPPATVATILLAALAAAAVLAVHETTFPHLSSNHDEGVYLQQAAMLLEGRLVMQAGPLADAVHPWFFVRDGGRLYPKYTPVTAAVFALAKLSTGSYVSALPAVAFANVLLCVLVVEAAFDRRTGLLAGAMVAASPLFLLTSATFLSYAPATALNLLFALAYVRAARRDSLRWAALAGVAVGLAFLARPYTAVLFAAPFVAHAAATLAGTALDARDGDARPLLTAARRDAVVGALGLAFVGLALAYNWRLTGDPLVFPYEALAPRDGPGFGHREILGHEREYTPGLALRANGLVLWTFLARWFVAPPFGALLAGAGVALTGWRLRDRWPPALPGGGLPPARLRVLLLGVVVSVAVGNVAFWGNLNVLGNLELRGDGLVSILGPFYHVDLLVPLAAFGAHAAAIGWDRLALAIRDGVGRQGRVDEAGGRDRIAAGGRAGAATVGGVDRSRSALAVALLLILSPAVAAEVAAVERPLERNRAYTERYASAYEPFEDRHFERAVVFVPTPYGEWLNHPFQDLRNDPGLDGPVLYVLDRDPAEDFAVLDARPGRRPYRFTYRGTWTGGDPRPVEARLQSLRVVEGERLAVRTTVGVPEGGTLSSIRLEAGDEVARYEATPRDGRLTLHWRVGPDGAAVVGDAEPLVGAAAPGDGVEVSIDGATELALAVTFVQPGGATLTYRQELTVEGDDGRVRAVWPPETRVCRLTADCGREGTYLPGHPDEHVEGVSVATRLSAGGNETAPTPDTDPSYPASVR